MADNPETGPGGFTIPDALPVLPLRDAILLPFTATPLVVGQPRSMRLVDDVMRGNRLLAVVAQRDPKVESATPEILHSVGTVGVIHQLARATDGTIRMMVQGLERARLKDWIQTEPYLVARIEPGATEGTSNLVGRSEVTMSGKAAAFGGRMMGSVADQILKQFAGNFSAQVQARAMDPPLSLG